MNLRDVHSRSSVLPSSMQETEGGELLDFHETEEKPLAIFYVIVLQAKIA